MSLISPRTAVDSGQRYYGPTHGDKVAQNLAFYTGQTRENLQRMRKMYGRNLAGMGSVEGVGSSAGVDPSYQNKAIYELEKEDDSFGSGIFDPAGRTGTSNPDMGVFSSSYDLPGYIARSVPFTVSKDVRDINSGADVVYIPAGGMAYVERNGKLAGPLHNPMSHVVPQVPQAIGPIPASPRNEGPIPFNITSRPVPKQNIVYRRQTPAPVNPVMNPVVSQAPDLPVYPAVDFTSTVNVGPTRPIPISGFGEDEEVKEPASVGQLALAGAAVGVAAALVYGALNVK